MTTILIDSSRNAERKAFLFSNPENIISTTEAAEVDGAISQLSDALNAGKYAAGFFSYELGYMLEPKLTRRLPKERQTPLLWFAIYDKADQLSPDEVDLFLNKKATGNSQPSISDIRLSETLKSYTRIFNQAQEYITSGDIYQLNLTFNAHFRHSGNPYALYRDLKLKQQMPHGAIIESDDFTIISASPELFLSINENLATTAPMKGTASRGFTLEQDMREKNTLHNDEKSRAENLMILDLMRNDLGRISKIGSVEVTDLFAIETYPTLHQMVSWVKSSLLPGITLKDWLKALHPPGSITGAPKVRAMEIINDLEKEERGAYTGAIGMLSPGTMATAQAHFNVGIRTLTLRPDGTGQMGIGSGVVADSKAEDEYNECILKMKFLTDPAIDFQLIETFAYNPEDGYLYYPFHLERLRKSAEYFAFKFNMQETESRLKAKEAELQGGYYRVRMLLFRNGDIQITETAVDRPDPKGTMKFILSEKRMNRNDVFLYHKTTNRTFYDNEHATLTAKHNCDEVIFMNEDEQLTEGSRTNIFIEKDGTLYTPPIECGLLAGTLRASLLTDGKILEKTLTVNDLENADNIYIGNSVRGLLKGIWKL